MNAPFIHRGASVRAFFCLAAAVAAVAALAGCPIANGDASTFGRACVSDVDCGDGSVCDPELDQCKPLAAGGRIVSFSASTYSVVPNEEFALSWQTEALTGCGIAATDTESTTDLARLPNNGSVNVRVTQQGPHTFQLTCSGSAGAVSSDVVTVDVDRVVAGDLLVANQGDLDAVAGVGRISGSLIFAPGAVLSSLDPLAQLSDVGVDLRVGTVGSLTSFPLPALTHVGRDLVFDGSDDLTTVELPVLSGVERDLLVQRMSALRAFRAPALTEIGRDLFLSTYAYPDYPASTGESSVTPLPLPLLDTVDFGELQTIGRNFDCEDAYSLAALNFPSLVSIGASFVIYNLGSSTAGASVDLPQLTDASTILVMESPGLVRFSAPLLTEVHGIPSVEEAYYAWVIGDRTITSPDDVPADPLFVLYDGFVRDIFQRAFHTGDVFFIGNGAEDPEIGATNDSLVDLDLSSLATLDGRLMVGFQAADMTFADLTRVRGLVIENHLGRTVSLPALTDVGTDGIVIASSPDLTEVSLPLLASASYLQIDPDAPGPWAMDAPVLAQVGNVTLDQIGGLDLSSLVFTDAALLHIQDGFNRTDLTGLSSVVHVGELRIREGMLVSLDGLSSLTTIDGALDLAATNALTGVEGLSKLRSVGQIDLTSGCENVQTFSLPELEAVTGVGSYGLSLSCPGLATVSLPALTMLNGALDIFAAPVSALDLGAVTSVGSVFLRATDLQNLDAFCSVTTIADSATFYDNTELADVSGLMFADVGGVLAFDKSFSGPGQPALDYCQVAQLADVTTPLSVSTDQVLPAACPLDAGRCPQ